MNPRGLQAFGKTRANSNNRLCAPLPGVGKGLPARTIHEERKSRAHCHFERSEKSAFCPALIGRKPSRARKRTPAVELPTRPLRCFGISGAAHQERAVSVLRLWLSTDEHGSTRMGVDDLRNPVSRSVFIRVNPWTRRMHGLAGQHPFSRLTSLCVADEVAHERGVFDAAG